MSDFTVHFLVSTKDEHFSGMKPYLTVAAEAVLVDETGKIRNASMSFRSEPGAEWADFQVAAQLDYVGGYNWYGHRIQYKNLFSVELMQAELMVKNLRSMHRKLERLDAKYGSTTDFAAFMGRVADAADSGERPFIRLVHQAPGFGGYDDNEYRFMNTDDLRYHLSAEVKTWREKYGLNES